MFVKMGYMTFYCVTLVLIAANFGQIQSVILREKTLQNVVDFGLELKDPTHGGDSSAVIYYDYFAARNNYEASVILRAPLGYGLLVTFSLIDFQPNRKDILTLSVPGTGNKETYANSKTIRYSQVWKKEDGKQFYSPTGKIEISFQSPSKPGMFEDYKGFKFTCTVQGNSTNPATCKSDFFKCNNGRCIASALKCDKFLSDERNHCGDRSDHSEKACSTTTVVSIVGISIGVIIPLIVVGGVIAFIIFRRMSQRSRNPGYVR